MILSKSLKEIRLKHYPLNKLSFFKVGGRAKNFFLPSQKEDLIHLLRELNKQNIPCYVLGGGSNILINDEGIINSAVVKLGKGFVFINRIDSLTLEVGAATSFRDLLDYCVKSNLGGLEMFAGIPATVGGMCVMNASSFGREFFSFVEEVEAVSFQGETKILKKHEINYGYRYTSLRDFIVTKVKLVLEKGKSVKERAVEFLKERAEKQDLSYPSLGCIFKNPPGMWAGKLIQECGLKGFGIGSIFVSSKHANFILNKGRGSFRDTLSVIETIKRKVYQRFSVKLEEEIVIWES
ncbi:MAG: UDP-N-acetylenolpyruvoylglucosamine reductase [Candidatus Omnitrophota bacterium]|nr:MAG: UDP-N-acetylenolpyruvoylglucosamine reductase [Candidatus Omnitrophota bacterium]